MYFVVVFLLVSALSSARSTTETPKRCDTPEQWEGTAWHDNQDRGVMIVSKLSYDAKGNRISTFSRFLNGPYAGKEFRMIFLYEEDRFYLLPVGTEICIVSNKFWDLIPAGVPEGAKFAYHVVRGLGKNSVTTNTFAYAYKVGRTKDQPEVPCKYGDDCGRRTHTWYGSFTEDLCVPVLETIYDGNLLGHDANEYYTETLHSIRFSDMSAGIKDPKVFDPPAYCSDVANGTLPSMFEETFKWHRYTYL